MNAQAHSRPYLNQIQITEILTPLDWFFFFLVLGLTFASVVWGNHLQKKKEKNTYTEFLVMGRQLTLPLFVATLVATWYGGIFGVTQIAFEHGIYNFLTQGVFWYITYALFAFFLVKKVRQGNAVTLPERVGALFGKQSAWIAGLFTYLNVVPVAYAISIGLLIQAFIGTSILTSTVLGVGLVLLYSTYGGLRSVVFSDLIQFFVMCLSVFLVVIFSFQEFGGLSFLTASLPESHFSWTGGQSAWVTFVWGLIALSTLVDPNFYQRCFAAKDSLTAKKGILFCTLIWMGFDICTTAGALYARAVIPEADSWNAYLTYSIQLLPNGLRGFFIAGILATILSTLDSYLFIAGSTLSHDLLRKKNKLVHWGAVVATGSLAVLLSLLFEGGIRSVWKTLGSYSASCLLFPMLWGYFFPGKISDRQFVVVVVLGAVSTTAWRMTERTGFLAEVDEIYIGTLCTSLTILFLLIKEKRLKNNS